MPFAGFDDFDDCMGTMTGEEGHDEDSARNICGALQQEAKSEHGNVDQLRAALSEGAGLIADVGVDLVSGVDVPAVDSKWVMTKTSRDEALDDLKRIAKSVGADPGDVADAVSDDFDPNYKSRAKYVLAKDSGEDQRISYAAAMIPREPDKEGDVVATPTVEKAAHGFLKQDGGVDTDHSLIDGEGDVVESWVLKQDREFDLPGGSTESYGAGTWMVGIEWGAEAWERIKSGELTGLSIYGMAEHVPLERAAKCCECGGRVSDSNTEGGDTPFNEASKSGGMGTETSNDPAGDADAGDGGGGGGDGSSGPSTGELQASVSDLAETVASVESTVESVKDAVETEKASAEEGAALIASELDLSEGDVMAVVEAAAAASPEAVTDAIEEAADTVAAEDDGDDDDGEEDEDEMDKAANMSKGYDGEATREQQTKQRTGEQQAGGSLSYADLAAQHEAGE